MFLNINDLEVAAALGNTRDFNSLVSPETIGQTYLVHF